jgi:hypothetical protein
MLNEISKVQKDKYHMFSLIYGIRPKIILRTIRHDCKIVTVCGRINRRREGERRG